MNIIHIAITTPHKAHVDTNSNTTGHQLKKDANFNKPAWASQELSLFAVVMKSLSQLCTFNNFTARPE
jgi:hypothetical protein